jgi:anhydro-N-acetylmuramic acid kinase
MNTNPNYYIGIMTGTSVDQADAVLVRFFDECSEDKLKSGSMEVEKTPTETTSYLDEKAFSIVDSIYLDFPNRLKESIQHLCDPNGAHLLQDISKTNILLTQFFAQAVKQLLVASKINANEVTAIGCHGQTIWHAPNETMSWQLCEGNYLASLTSIPVVTDFRQLDVALGGQGAPLIPLFQSKYFRSTNENRVLLNLGGIANICVLNANQKADVVGFDTGPANTLLDQWYQIHKDGAFDPNGDWASSGQINSSLLQSFLSDSYFEQKAPKSTGREYFNMQWVEQHLAQFDTQKPEDVQATLLELTAQTIKLSLEKIIQSPYTMLVFGGGVHNKALMGKIRSLLSTEVTINLTNEVGIEVDIMEALCFAWLAKMRIEETTLDARSITGSYKPHLFGTIYQP